MFWKRWTKCGYEISRSVAYFGDLRSELPPLSCEGERWLLRKVLVCCEVGVPVVAAVDALALLLPKMEGRALPRIRDILQSVTNIGRVVKGEGASKCHPT